jgi:(1->4)-alpha-D-glucan 1-alpha-D-glucosylmutase
MSTPGVELRATYRLQLTSEFGFAAARSLVSYLRDLGISHLYLSPSFQARPGSGHGYDVIDPGKLSRELGGEREFRALAQAARDAGMGIVLDVVPNHMAADDANRYWAELELREQFFDLDPVTGRHRRFFDIDELAALRQEDPAVFAETHRLALELVSEGLIDGLRVDHPDGLADPAGYLARLREGGADRVWVEKILAPDEHLRHWPVTGTVGYEFLNDVCALFIDPAGEKPLTALWEELSGDERSFGELAGGAKLEQITTTFGPELERLARELEAEPPGGLDGLARAVASLPVYRTYVDPARGLVDDQDRRAVDAAEIPPELRRMLLLEQEAPRGFVTRFQQTTPAVMAKGVEDTAFYRYARLLALNDVGGEPSRFGIDVARFHAGNLERAERFPQGLLTTMTHDAKRSGDVRARIGALSGIADEWALHVRHWMEVTDSLRDNGAPDDVERYFLFQTLLGAWPIEVERVDAYMEKALREAKRNTNWVEPNQPWEDAVRRFVRAVYSHRPFLDDFEPFVARVAPAGDRAALRALVLKLTAPGVPDIYQGDELPYRALVDPDNRRPVDWGWRHAMLKRLMGGSPPIPETRKLWTCLRLLTLRSRHPEPFAGGYEPLSTGPGICGFVRGGEILVAVATRENLAEDETIDTPPGNWRDVLHGDERSLGDQVPAGGLLDDTGVAVLTRFGS